MISNQIVEQIIRPTGLIDPEVEIRPIHGQIDDLIKEIKIRPHKMKECWLPLSPNVWLKT